MTEGNIDKDLKELLEKEVVSLLKEQLVDYEVKLKLADNMAAAANLYVNGMFGEKAFLGLVSVYQKYRSGETND